MKVTIDISEEDFKKLNYYNWISITKDSDLIMNLLEKIFIEVKK